MSGRRLGEILLDHGWITRGDLARALKSQQLVGGRLGSCLLETEAISEELLVQALAEQLGVPPASIEDLRHVEPDTLAMVPRRLAVRCRAIPLHATGNRLDLATSDPGNLACQDEIAFATSRRLVVRVASEARIAEALARYYDEPPAGRLVGLVDRLNRQRDAWRAAAAAAGGGEGNEEGERELLGRIGEVETGAAGGEGGPAAGGEAKGFVKRGIGGGRAAGGEDGAAAGERQRGAAAGDRAAAIEGPATAGAATGAGPRVRPSAVSLSEAERLALLGAAAAPTEESGTTASPAAGPSSPGRSAAPTTGAAAGAGAATSPPPPAPPAGGPRAVPEPPRREPTTVAVAAAQLGEAVERDEVGRIAVGYLRQLFDRVLLLAVRRDGVRGWLGAGDGVDRERLDDLAIPFDRPSVFLNLRQGSPLHLGPLPPMPAHRPLLAVLGGDPPGPCLLLPVQVAGRLVAVIYGDREGAPVGGIDLDGLRRLAEQAGLALERCISLKRKAHSGPAAG